MQSKYVSAPCAPPYLIASPSPQPVQGVGREFALLAASSNQKKLAPRRVKLFSCGILVLIARHRAQPSIPQRVTKVVCFALLWLPQPSRGNFWPSHRRAKYVYTTRREQAQTRAQARARAQAKARTQVMGKFPYTHNLGFGLRLSSSLSSSFSLATTAQKSQFRTQIKIIESKCSNGSSSMVNALQTGLRSTR